MHTKFVQGDVPRKREWSLAYLAGALTIFALAVSGCSARPEGSSVPSQPVPQGGETPQLTSNPAPTSEGVLQSEPDGIPSAVIVGFNVRGWV